MKNYILTAFVAVFLGVASVFAFNHAVCCKSDECKKECIQQKCCQEGKTCDKTNHKDCKHKCCDKKKTCDKHSSKEGASCAMHKGDTTTHVAGAKKCCATKK